MKLIRSIKNTAKFFKNELWGGRESFSDAGGNILNSLLSMNSGGSLLSPDDAMRQATVYSCVTLIADNVAQLPLHLYRKTEEGRQKAFKHPLYEILNRKPNEWQTPFEFYQFLLLSLLLRGMACAYIVRAGGKIKSLLPVPPDCISEVWEGNKRYFLVSFADGVQKEVDPGHIFCIKAMSFDGKTSASPITYAANTVGVSLAAEKYNAGFYRNGARPSGILTTAQSLSKETAKEIGESWLTSYGRGNSGKTAVLWGGMEYRTVSMSNEDAQLLQLMSYQRTDIASIFRVPPHMVGAVDKTSSWGTGIAEQKQSFLTFTLQPWITRIQQAVSRDLLREEEKKDYYAEFLTDKFLQADQKSRTDSYKAALGGTQHPGYMTVNEIRRLENLPAAEGGDKLYSPVPPIGGEQSGEDK